jgi:serine/threonine protein kinase
MTHKCTGEIYLAYDLLSERYLAVKMEPIHRSHQTLEHEFDIYRKLRGGIGIPHVYWFGIESGFNAMAMDLLGHSLEDLFFQNHFQFSTGTVVLLACQLVSTDFYVVKLSLSNICYI